MTQVRRIFQLMNKTDASYASVGVGEYKEKLLNRLLASMPA